MRAKHKYLVVNLTSLEAKKFSYPNQVAEFLVGRNERNYLIIKDENVVVHLNKDKLGISDIAYTVGQA